MTLAGSRPGRRSRAPRTRAALCCAVALVAGCSGAGRGTARHAATLPAAPPSTARATTGPTAPGASATPAATSSGTVGTAVATTATTRTARTASAQVLLAAAGSGPDGLVTNEWAHFDAGDPAAVRSPVWDMDSGSLFRRDGAWWSGAPDDAVPDATSSDGTGSAVFRLVTRRRFGDVRVSLDLRVDRLGRTPSTPPVAWDGVHVFLRYRSETSLYYASVARRDGHVVVKKKCPGGTENGGTYYELGGGELAGHPVPPGRWRQVVATVRTVAPQAVRLTLAVDGRTLLAVTDRGTGCAPIVADGATGLRGDNADFRFRDVTVTALR